MTYLIDAIRALLMANPALVTLIGDRFFPLVLPQTELLPAITYQEISGNPYNVLGGTRANATQIRIQISVYSKTYQEASAVSAAVQSVLDTYRGTTSGIYISNLSFQGKRDFYEKDAKIHHQANDFLIHLIN